MFFRHKSMAPMWENVNFLWLCTTKERLRKIALLSELLLLTDNSRAIVKGTWLTFQYKADLVSSSYKAILLSNKLHNNYTTGFLISLFFSFRKGKCDIKQIPSGSLPNISMLILHIRYHANSQHSPVIVYLNCLPPVWALSITHPTPLPPPSIPLWALAKYNFARILENLFKLQTRSLRFLQISLRVYLIKNWQFGCPICIAGWYTGIVSNQWYLGHTGFDTACLLNIATPSRHYGLPENLFHSIFQTCDNVCRKVAN